MVNGNVGLPTLGVAVVTKVPISSLGSGPVVNNPTGTPFLRLIEQY
jgi:hypothetical protein